MADLSVDIWDERAKPTGKTLLKSEAHAQGLWHPTAHIWIYSEDGYVLFQHRAKTKEIYPDFYDVAAAGHVDAGEKPIEGALRELKEELGLVAEPEALVYQGLHKFETPIKGWKNPHREFLHTYFLVLPKETDLVLQEDEVQGFVWVKPEAVLEALKQPACRYITAHNYTENMMREILRRLNQRSL